jgi:hypothetical protein
MSTTSVLDIARGMSKLPKGWSQGDVLYLSEYKMNFQQCIKGPKCQCGNQMPNGNSYCCTFLHHTKEDLNTLIKKAVDEGELTGNEKKIWNIASKLYEDLDGDKTDEDTVTNESHSPVRTFSLSQVKQGRSSTADLQRVTNIYSEDAEIEKATAASQADAELLKKEEEDLAKATALSLVEHDNEVAQLRTPAKISNGFLQTFSTAVNECGSPLTTMTEFSTASAVTSKRFICSAGTIVGKKNGGDGELVSVPYEFICPSVTGQAFGIAGYHDIRQIGLDETVYAYY